MIEESGVAVSVEKGAVWVETRRQSTCGSCSARSMCGQEVLQKLGRGSDCHLVRALNSYPVQIGDRLTIAIPEQVIVRGAVLVYLLPLVLMMAALFICQTLALREGLVIVGSFTGLATGFAVVALRSRYLNDNNRVQPHVISVALGQAPMRFAESDHC